IGGERLDLFNEKYAGVLEEQEQLIKRSDEAMKEVQAKQQKETAEIESKKAKLEQEKNTTLAQKDAVRDRLTKQWDVTKKEYDKLATAYTNSMATLGTLNAERAQINAQLASMYPASPGMDGSGNYLPGESTRFYNQMNMYSAYAARYQAQMDILDQRIL